MDKSNEIKEKIMEYQSADSIKKSILSSFEERIEIYESMIRQCAVAIFAIDTSHRIIHWNKACEELTGLKAEEVLGTQNHWKAFYEIQRPCLSDILIDGKEEILQEHYGVYGSSVLMPYSLHAEGWYAQVGGRERYLIFDASPVFGRDHKLLAAIETLQDISELKRTEEERKKLNIKLQDALDRIKTLSGLIPICAGCKKIRDDTGYWNQLEEYLEEHSAALFSHGLCPDCFKRFFSEPDEHKEEV
jgi:transcriptional regulator with PAS, ATPase and Fis domain